MVIVKGSSTCSWSNKDFIYRRHFFGVENYSTVYPIISFATSFGSAFALALVGYIYDFTGSYVLISYYYRNKFYKFDLIYIVVKQYSLKKNSTVEKIAVSV